MPNVEAVVCNIRFIDRPTCSCGLKMESVEYEGYYDSFNYWVCQNCDLDDTASKDTLKY